MSSNSSSILSPSSRDSQLEEDGLTVIRRRLAISARRGGPRCGYKTACGLKGGADSQTKAADNSSTSWGNPPASAASGGWGAAPPPNPTASAAWGGKAEDKDEKAPAVAPKAASTPSTSTSWAAAAQKGLPTTSSSNSNNETTSTMTTTSNSASTSGSASTSAAKFEQLNAVREALYSQDGWGGSNVKQDTSWDVDNGGGKSAVNGQQQQQQPQAASTPQSQQPQDAGAASAAMPPKESNMWGGVPTGQGSSGIAPRNDGTDLWKTTLSGQPPAPKPQQPNPWAPQNPTDYRIWGEPDDDANQGQSQGHGNNPQQGNEFWREQQPNQYNSEFYLRVNKLFTILITHLQSLTIHGRTITNNNAVVGAAICPEAAAPVI